MICDLNERIDALARGECTPGAFKSEVSVLLDTTPDAAWEALAILDQHHRRGRLPIAVFRDIRQWIERRVLGVADVYAAPGAPPASPQASDAAAVESQYADELHRLRTQLRDERARSLRYRNRIATLAEFARRQRTALAVVQRGPGAALRHGASPALGAAPRRRRRARRLLLALRRLQPASLRPAAQSVIALLVAIAIFITGASPDNGSTPLSYVAQPRLAPPAAAPPMASVATTASPAPDQITLASDRYVVFPGNSTATIVVKRAGAARGPVNFTWWTQGSGARAGRDFVFGKARPAHLAAGDDTVQLSVPILPNSARRHTELFYVNIGAAEGSASFGPVTRATVFIMRPD